jgi:protein O-mannosyl-transferase
LEEANNLKRVIVTTLVLLTLVVYVNSISGSFVYDDLTVVGPHLAVVPWRASTLANVFTRDFWSGIQPDRFGKGLNSIYYRPLFSLYLMLLYRLLKNSAAYWHAITMFKHILAVIFAFQLMERSLRFLSSFGSRERYLLAGLAAAIFAVHPVQSESVAWISAIGNPSSTILIFGAAYWYLKYLEHGKKRQMALSVAIFSLAIFWKENAIVLLAILPAYELLALSKRNSKLEAQPQERKSAIGKYYFAKRVVIRMLPFAGIALGYFVLRFVAIGSFLGHYNSANFPDDMSLTLSDNLRTLPALILSYLKMIVWPTNLSPFYGFTYVRSLTLGLFWVPLVVVGSLFAILVYACLKSPELRLSATWMILPLLPHLNTLGHSSEELIQDHYLYVPVMGYGLLVASVIIKLGREFWPAYGQHVLIAISVIAITGFSIMTARHNRVWQNQELLWQGAVSSAPNSRIVHLELGRLAEEKNDPELAEREYRAVLSINPDIVDGLNNLAFVEAKEGRWDEATAGFERVVSLSPQKALAHFNLAVAYRAEKRYADAAREMQQAIDLDPTAPLATESRKMLERWKGKN